MQHGGKMKFNTSKIILVSCFLLLIIIGISEYNLTQNALANTSTLLPRSDHQMVYDSKNNQIIMYGGEVSGGSLTDLESTLIFSSENKTWTKLSGLNSPGRRFHHRMVYNSITGKVFLYGGISLIAGTQVNDTWEFDPETNEWTELHPINSPPVMCSQGMYFDSEYNEVILYGGVISPTSVSNEMWAYNYSSSNWYQIYPSYSIGEGYGHSFAYDESKKVGVLFGGRLGNMYLKNDLITFNRTTNSWEKKYPVTKPLERYFTGFVFNSNDNSFIMFGGDNDETPTRALSDTWVYDTEANSWSEIETSENPPARCKHAMVFDQYLNKTIVFGGLGENFDTVYDDLWIYDPITMTWSQEFVSSSESTVNSLIPIWIPILGLISIAYFINTMKRKQIVQNNKI